MKKAATGFTLIELSIVLVIIGLVIGGVLAGKALIRASEIQSIITDENKYIGAARTFQQKYRTLPGDMPNATSYWGVNPGGCPFLGPWTTTPQTTTCNGNGDGLIESDGTGETPPNEFENFLAWQHLANAGMIEGSFSGTPGPASDLDNEPGFNVPATRLAGGGFEWMVLNASSKYPPSTTWVNPKLYHQYLLVGNNCYQRQYCQKDLVGFLLTAADALSIDTKIDDGLPGSGLVLGTNIYDTATSTSCSGGPNTTYNVATNVAICNLLFEVDW